MNRTVYFHIDEVARDSIVAANLRKALRPFGVEVDYGGRSKSYYLKHAYPYDAVVFPSVDLMSAYYDRPEDVAEPVILLPTEGIGGICYNPWRLALHLLGDRFMQGDRRWAERADAHALWGALHLENIRQFAPDLVDRCRIVGHPRHDRRCLETPAGLWPDRDPADGRIRVGLLTRFDRVNLYDGRSFLQNVYENRQGQGYEYAPEDAHLNAEDAIYTTVVDMRVLLDIVDRLNPATHQAIIRVHPREDRSRWEQLIGRYKLNAELAPWDQPFIPWLRGVDYLVSPPSTTFYDSFLLGKVGVCTMNVNPKRKEHEFFHSDEKSPLTEHILAPGSMDEMIEILSRRPPENGVPPSPSVARTLAYEAGSPDNLNAIDALARLCLEVMDRKPLSACDPASSGRFQRRRLFEIPDPDQAAPNEQSCNFTLTKSRRRWIDSLAGL